GNAILLPERRLTAPVDTHAPVIPLWGRALKRTVDVVASGLLLILLLPVLLAIAIAVRIDSAGGSFFVQERVGLNGRTFKFFKFRTMFKDNDDTLHREYVASLIRGDGDVNPGGMFKLTDDPRITRVGRFLR